MLGPGDQAFLVFCTATALLTTPALGLFFGGMVRRKNVLATFQGCFIVLGAVALQWLALGHGLALGRSVAGGLLGAPDGLSFGFGADSTPDAALRLTFELTAAAFAAALLTGAAAERVRFGPMTVFVLCWTTLVYDPLAHWVWGPSGWLRGFGVHDFGGGLVIHVAAGVSALGCAVMLGKRRGLDAERFQPHNLTLTAIGAGLLWLGWIGLNMGRARGFTPSTAAALTSTIFGGSAGLVGWSLIERLRDGKATPLGTCTGAVAGLVGVTAGAGFITPVAAVAIGGLAAALSYGAVCVKRKLGYDDALDVFAVHGVGGIAGVLAVGVLADPAIDGEVAGLFYGNAALIAAQGVGVAVVAMYALVATTALWFVVDRLLGLRVDAEDEELGLDLSQHGQRGYILGEGERLGG
jgi:Amt family ammonium transporter